MSDVNLEGLSSEQLDLVRRFADVLRTAREREASREQLRELWSKAASAAQSTSEVEAEALAAGAVSFARGRR